MLPIKRKLNSAVWRLKQALTVVYQRVTRLLVETLTEKYWLIDYLPTFAKRKDDVVLIRLDLIGDFVLWLDSAQAYRRIYPGKKITLLVNSTCAELAQALPHWDEVIGINVQRLREDFRYRLASLIKLRLRNFSIAIQPSFSREFVGDLALRATNAPSRIGYTGDTNNITHTKKVMTDNWYNKLVANHHSFQMELSTNAHFVREIGCHDFRSSTPSIPKVAKAGTQLQVNKPYIVVAPGASWRPKMWAIDNFAELIRLLDTQFDTHFILCGGSDDYATCKELAQKTGLNNLTNLAGQTSLLDVVEIIRAATFVVTNDSSPVHIAAATGTPAVCILGGGHFGRFLPYTIENLSSSPPKIIAVWHEMDCFGCSWRCQFKLADGQAVPCISMISIDNLINHCQDLLAHACDKNTNKK